MAEGYTIGFLGASRIARKFASDARYKEGAKLYAVGARNIEAAEAFQKEFNLQRSYGSYEEMINDEKVDIIYISTPNALHKEHVLMCLKAGKAAICEKPFALNAKEAQEMIQAARGHNVFLMEAMWTRYLPSVRKAKAWVEEGKIGNVKLLQGDFGFRGEDHEDIRFQRELGGGALLDVGVYPVSFASFIFGMQPERIDASAVLTQKGVDETICMQFIYDEGQMAQLSASIGAGTPRNAYIIGDKGYIHMPQAWYGKLVNLYNSEGVLTEHFIDETHELGYRFELEEVINCLRKGKTESSRMALQESLEIVKTLDRIRSITGIKYPTD